MLFQKSKDLIVQYFFFSDKLKGIIEQMQLIASQENRSTVATAVIQETTEWRRNISIKKPNTLSQWFV